tara:strand:+ start:602 stop:754 length:153 start_codon:yes stop_codon:yes gene_type:complete
MPSGNTTFKKTSNTKAAVVAIAIEVKNNLINLRIPQIHIIAKIMGAVAKW